MCFDTIVSECHFEGDLFNLCQVPVGVSLRLLSFCKHCRADCKVPTALCFLLNQTYSAAHSHDLILSAWLVLQLWHQNLQKEWIWNTKPQGSAHPSGKFWHPQPLRFAEEWLPLLPCKSVALSCKNNNNEELGNPCVILPTLSCCLQVLSQSEKSPHFLHF